MGEDQRPYDILLVDSDTTLTAFVHHAIFRAALERWDADPAWMRRLCDRAWIDTACATLPAPAAFAA